MNTENSDSSWIIFPKPNPAAKMRLFCFPYAGGGTSLYRPWAERLSDDIELGIIILPGREHRITEPLVNELTTIVSKIESNILSFLDKPFAFLGHSIGSLISFELMEVLNKNYNKKPDYYFVSAYAAPHIKNRKLRMSELGDDELINTLKNYNGTPPQVLENPLILEYLLPIVRADFSIYDNYKYVERETLNCPLSVFMGKEDDIEENALQAWRNYTDKEFELHKFNGGHFYINDYTEEVIEIIHKSLNL